MVQSDAHIVATLFRVHKQAKSSHKLSCLYIIDAISREAKHQVKRSRDKGKQVEDDTGSATPTGDADDTDSRRRDKIKGTHASFLSKIENFLDRLVGDVLTKGPPEHKVSCLPAVVASVLIPTAGESEESSGYLDKDFDIQPGSPQGALRQAARRGSDF